MDARAGRPDLKTLRLFDGGRPFLDIDYQANDATSTTPGASLAGVELFTFAGGATPTTLTLDALLASIAQRAGSDPYGGDPYGGGSVATLMFDASVALTDLTYRWAARDSDPSVAVLKLFDEGRLLLELDFDATVPQSSRTVSLSGTGRFQFASGQVLLSMPCWARSRSKSNRRVLAR